MSKKIDDYLDLNIRDNSSSIIIEGSFTFKTIQEFHKNAYSQFEEEIKCISRMMLLNEITKLISKEIEENGDKILEISGKVLKSRIFGSDEERLRGVMDLVRLALLMLVRKDENLAVE